MPERQHHGPRPSAPADIETALLELGVEVVRANDDELTAFCPGHLRRVGREERNPSWSVNRDSGLHNCYSCGFKGTFLQLTMELRFPNDVFRAARWLRQFGANLARATELQTFEERSEQREETVELVPETRLAMYETPPDWALEERSLSRESVDHYGVRWNPARDAWIIPVRERSGELLGWQEKWQRKRRFMNRPKHMVKSLSLFGYDAFPVGEPAVVLESPLDVLRLYTAGYEGGLSTYGAHMSAAQLRMLAEVTDELVSALDDDKDGRKAAEELRVGRVGTARPSRLFHLTFLAYDLSGSDSKDIGGMSDDQIERALYERRHHTVARPVGVTRRPTRAYA